MVYLLKMVDLSMAMLNNQMVYIYNWDIVGEDEKVYSRFKQPNRGHIAYMYTYNYVYIYMFIQFMRI